MVCLDIVILWERVSAINVFLWGSFLPYINAIRILVASRYALAFLLACVPCIWEKCGVLYDIAVKLRKT
jgi:hypothetical protein